MKGKARSTCLTFCWYAINVGKVFGLSGKSLKTASAFAFVASAVRSLIKFKTTMGIWCMANLKKLFNAKYKSQIQQELGLPNDMQVPKLEKIIVNVGLGEALQNSKLIDSSVEQLRTITGQAPVVTKAKKSISNFKTRKGAIAGVKVTLRKKRMYEFLDRLINIAIPRIRDFRGLNPKSFDGNGNYTLGIKEQIIFPEIDIDKVKSITGLDITFVTSITFFFPCINIIYIK